MRFFAKKCDNPFTHQCIVWQKREYAIKMKIYLIIAAITLCIDTLAVGIACGAGKMRFSADGWTAFFLTGAVVVILSAFLGRMLVIFKTGKTIGGILLALTGFIIILQETGFLKDIPLLGLITAPETSDTDNNRIIDGKEASVLAFALSVDSCIACTGSGKTGLFLPAAVIIMQPFFINLGILIGKYLDIKGGGRFCSLLSGVMLLALGVENICMT